MSILLNGDCLEEMKGLDDNSIDFIFCDLPYGQTSCSWDCCIDLEPFWKEIMRIKKLNTPIFFTTTTKFGVSLINSAPKKCYFRYDLVWVKSAPAGFLSAKKMPMRKHEMIYVFYEKLPFYDLSSHTHKFIKAVPTNRAGKDNVDNKGMIKNRSKSGMETQNKYTPPLPTSVIKGENNTYNTEGRNKPLVREPGGKYQPPLPTSVVKETVQKEADLYGKNSRKEYNKEYAEKKGYNKNQVLYDPPLPVSVVKETVNKNYGCPRVFYTDENGNIIKEGQSGKDQTKYDPPLPTSMLEVKSTKGKHSTEKPVALMEWLLKYYSKEGDVVLDPTMGSGSTGVACKNMNRNFIGIEKDEEIYEVACKRVWGD